MKNKAKKVTQCTECGKIGNFQIKQFFPLIDFTGIKCKSSVVETFCSKECKGKTNLYRQEYVLPYLAELDLSMNFCEFFVRTDGNNGEYIRDGFKIKVNGLWDYKSTPQYFLDEFYNHFGHYDYYELHSRYDYLI